MTSGLLAIVVVQVGWVLMTLVLLRRVLRDGHCPIPAMVLPLSLAWDCVLFATPSAGSYLPKASPLGAALLVFSWVWLPLDLAVLYAALRSRDRTARPGGWFWSAFLLLFALSASALLLATRRSVVPTHFLVGWVATSLKCLWAAFFLYSLWRSRDGRGQSPGAWALRFSLCTAAPLLITGFQVPGAGFAALIGLDVLLETAFLPVYLAKRRAMAAARG